jgi:Uma2 family endonuclease
MDPDQQSIEAYELVGDQYNLAFKAQNAERFNPTLFPGLSIMLADLWS